MTEADIRAVVEGRHGDAFRILGPHKMERFWEVRAFLPHAAGAVVLTGGERFAMVRNGNTPFFIAEMALDPGAYRIEYETRAGLTAEMEDPYRFPLLLTPLELYLHGEGNNFESWLTMGAHPLVCEGVEGYRFAVWAPNAENVSVVGEYNDWHPHANPMRWRDGVWELFLPGVTAGAQYKYNVRARNGAEQMKSDPYAFSTEVPPRTASITAKLDTYTWGDGEWMNARANFNWQKMPVSVYEVHLESWKQHPDGELLTYRELADQLVPYVVEQGFTHIELLPIMEYPYSGSWGYQVTGYFAPTSRFGNKDDFSYFIDKCHQGGLGVLVDWVPAHFPKDAHGLARFDGTAVYEHEDPRLGEQLDWGTLVFNFGRNEVRQFLISNALFWLKHYHIDGLRVDAVASMLYLDFSREPGQWIPNKYGGRENLEAITFLKRFNELAHEVPGAVTIAEESTSFPGVSRPVYVNGLGFSMKWNMGWMHDMLHYFGIDPVHRKYNHNDITFSLFYAFSENFLLPISHDEVVHGKSSLIGKMPGDEWRRFANARAFLSYMWTHPGKKLLFMGCELGQYEEWNYKGSLRWDLLQYKFHAGLQALVRDLNHLYRSQRALYEVDFAGNGFEWVDFHDVQHSVISFLRKADDPKDFVLVCCNFTPLARPSYEVGVPAPGTYEEIFNSDHEKYGGSGVVNPAPVYSLPEGRHTHPQHIRATLPPLGVTVWRRCTW